MSSKTNGEVANTQHNSEPHLKLLEAKANNMD